MCGGLVHGLAIGAILGAPPSKKNFHLIAAIMTLATIFFVVSASVVDIMCDPWTSALRRPAPSPPPLAPLLAPAPSVPTTRPPACASPHGMCTPTRTIVQYFPHRDGATSRPRREHAWRNLAKRDRKLCLASFPKNVFVR